LVVKLEKLEKLDELLRKVDSRKVSTGNEEEGQVRAADLKQEIESLQVIIFDPDNKYSEKEREDANIKMEKAIQAYTKTEEYKQEVQKQIEERRRVNEPLNKASLEKMVKIYNLENIKNDGVLKDKILKNPELALIGLDSKAILSKHQNDFQQYLLRNLEIDELRAIRASLPKFRNDQKRQIEWVEFLENKIEETAKGNPGLPPRPPSIRTVLWRPKTSSIPGSGGDMFSELLKKRTRVESDITSKPVVEVETPPPKKEIGSIKLAPRKTAVAPQRAEVAVAIAAPPSIPPPL